MRVARHWHELPRKGADTHPGNIQGQDGQEEPDLVKDVSAHCREVKLNEL